MPLTSSPFWIRRLELMMILWPLSKVTTSATQFGAHEWLMYLESTMAYAVGVGGHGDLPATPCLPNTQGALAPLIWQYPLTWQAHP